MWLEMGSILDIGAFKSEQLNRLKFQSLGLKFQSQKWSKVMWINYITGNLLQFPPDARIPWIISLNPLNFYKFHGCLFLIHSYSEYLHLFFQTFTEECHFCLTPLDLQFSHLRCVPQTEHFSLDSAALEITSYLQWELAIMCPRRKCQATPSLSKLSETVEVESKSLAYNAWAPYNIPFTLLVSRPHSGLAALSSPY